MRSPGAVIGFGVYEASTETQRIAGPDVPVRYEFDGHEWAMDSSYVSDPGGSEILSQASAGDEPRLVVPVLDGLSSPARWDLLADGEVVDSYAVSSPGPQGARGPGYVVQPGERPEVVLRVARGVTPETRLGFASYALVR